MNRILIHLSRCDCERHRRTKTQLQEAAEQLNEQIGFEGVEVCPPWSEDRDQSSLHVCLFNEFLIAPDHQALAASAVGMRSFAAALLEVAGRVEGNARQKGGAA